MSEYQLVAMSVACGESLIRRQTIMPGDIMRNVQTGEAFMVESDEFVHAYYGGNVWDDDLWRWQGDFPEAPWQSE